MSYKAVIFVGEVGLEFGGGCSISFGRNATRFSQTVNVLYERSGALVQIGIICGPVIHLQIYVNVIIRLPGRFVALIPYSLKICGKLAVFS